MSTDFREADITSTAAIAAWLGFAVWATYSVFAEGSVELYAENGLIESLQVYLLAVACAVYVVTLALETRPDKLLLLTCTLLCYGFIVRELDVENFAIPQVLIFIGSGVGRTVTLALAMAAIALYAMLTDPVRYAKTAVAFARSRPGLLFIAGCVFLVIGDLLEKNKLLIQHVFFEEMAELFGYLLILLASIAGNSFLHGLTIRSVTAFVPGARRRP